MKIIQKTIYKLLFVYSFTNTHGEKFWGNVGAGVLPIAKNTGRILVNHRSSGVNEPNTWGVWGGALKNQESPRQGARTEFEEETEYIGHIDLIPSYIFKKERGGIVVFEYHNFIGLVDGEFEPSLDWESQGYRWLTYSELLELPNKHFGLQALLQHDGNKIKQFAERYETQISY